MATERQVQLGMIGLAVMGRNLALNVLDHGYSVMGYNRSPEPLARALCNCKIHLHASFARGRAGDFLARGFLLTARGGAAAPG